MEANALGQSRGRFSWAVALLRLLLFVVIYWSLQQLLGSWYTVGTLISALFAGIFLLTVLEKRPASDLGFALRPQAALQFLVGNALGIVGLALGCLALLLFGSLRYVGEAGNALSWLKVMLGALGALVIPAAAEEALFRGYPFQKLVEGFGAVFATFLASLLFALAHANNPSVNGFALVNIFAAGVMLSVAYLRTRSLWFATGVHLGWNWSMAALFDLPVSGLELINAPGYDPVDRGPAWFSGGAFGPEAGLSGLLGVTLILVGVIWMTRKWEWLK